MQQAQPVDAMLSIVIPALNAAAELEATLGYLAPEAGGCETVVADGGSSDETLEVATRHGAKAIACPRGRGLQLAAGAGASAGDWLLFLHADTRPEAGWREACEAFMQAPANRRRAGYFRYALDDESPRARRLERIVAWRSRRLGLPYGDQGLLISRGFYFALGGFHPLPLMEDVNLALRIRPRRLQCLDVAAVTSAERYRRGGYLPVSARNTTLLGLYLLGVPAAWLAALYR